MGIVHSVGKKLMLTESAWNPKVAASRMMSAIVPESFLHVIKKRYYAYVLLHAPADWAEKERALVEKFISRDDEVADVGASIGGYTKFLSARARRVYSFEPNPSVFDFLCYNVTKLGLSNVEIFPCALSDFEGTSQMVIPQYRWGSECHYDATLDLKQRKDGARLIEVQVKRLDSILAGKRISFIKSDVNGHELPFVRGALETIRNSKPAILMEVLGNPDKPGSDAQVVFSLLAEQDYNSYFFDGKNLRRRRPGERSQNYLFLAA